VLAFVHESKKVLKKFKVPYPLRKPITESLSTEKLCKVGFKDLVSVEDKHGSNPDSFSWADD
jgi:hypothetical protein